MATARAIFQAHVDGLTPESLPFDLQWTMGVTSGVIRTIDWGIGDNLITPPTNSTLVAVKPPPASTAVLKLKGVGGDTGVLLHPTNPFIVSITLGQSFTVNASAAVSGVLLLMI